MSAEIQATAEASPVVAVGGDAGTLALSEILSAVTGATADGSREVAWFATRGDFRTARFRVGRFFESSRASLALVSFRDVARQLVIVDCAFASASAFRASSRVALAALAFFFARLK